MDEKMASINDKFKQNLDQKEVKLRSVERFVNLFLPIRCQTQISETLGACLPRQALAKLDNYEQEKFVQLNDAVLGDFKITDLGNSMKTMMTNI